MLTILGLYADNRKEKNDRKGGGLLAAYVSDTGIRFDKVVCNNM